MRAGGDRETGRGAAADGKRNQENSFRHIIHTGVLLSTKKKTYKKNIKRKKTYSSIFSHTHAHAHTRARGEARNVSKISYASFQEDAVSLRHGHLAVTHLVQPFHHTCENATVLRVTKLAVLSLFAGKVHKATCEVLACLRIVFMSGMCVCVCWGKA